MPVILLAEDEEEFRHWEGFGLALQAYLPETRDDLEWLGGWAGRSGRRVTVRLIKGAYWEYEAVTARQKGWPIPVYSEKGHTDWNFERCTDLLLERNDCVTAAIGSITAPAEPQPPRPFNTFTNNQTLQRLPEREIVRILDGSGNLLASPFGRTEDALPLTPAGLTSLQTQNDWWETGTFQDQSVLIFSHPIVTNGKTAYIIQVARPLTEQIRSLNYLKITLLVASLLTILIAFGIGWVFSRITLAPINRITQTARDIGDERDFTRRVAYDGPQDEVGQLATTFNSMLARLQDAYQQVAHSLEMQRDFVADVSHELRTPLTTLRGNLGLLRREPPIRADERADILTDMTDESDRMIRLVNDLLILARADAGQTLHHEPLSVRPLLEDICRQAKLLTSRTTLLCIPPEEDIVVVGDRDALKQVLLILLDNALKYTPSGGEVTIEARSLPARNGAITQIELAVIDTGVGIAEKDLPRLTERFYRVDKARSRDLGGTGLGLAIVKHIVQAHKGDLTIESVLKRGTTVRVRLAATLAARNQPDTVLSL